jgi:octaprenyl-diphosphate synthase
VLDLAGADDVAGKTLGTDLGQQKLTLPAIHCLTRLPESEANAVRAAITAGDTPTVLAAIRRTGSLAHATYRAGEFAAAAASELDDVPAGPAKDVLTRLPAWAVSRDA